MEKINILLVEDEKNIRINIKTMLEIEGYHVIDAADGLEAVDMLALHSFDLIVTDIMMQNMNGLELLNFVRSNSLLKQLPIVFVTAKPQKDIQDLLNGNERNFYLGKPFSFVDLKNVVKKAIAICLKIE
jgi:two-component system, sensor histidine kinase and response regulator